MTTPLHNDVEAALRQLRDQQADLERATAAIADAETTATSKDRLVEATVDGQGRLTGVKITSRRFRELAPAELSARITETVRAAQEQQADKTMAALMRFAPPGVDVAAMFDGRASVDDMLEAASAQLADVFGPIATRPGLSTSGGQAAAGRAS